MKKRSYAKPLCALALALLMLLGLTACGGPKTIDTADAMKEVSDMFGDIEQGDSYSMDISVSLDGNPDDIEKAVEALREDAAEDADASLSMVGGMDGLTDIAKELGVKLKPGRLVGMGIDYDGSDEDDPKARITVSIGNVDIELIGTDGTLYAGLGGIRDLVNAIATETELGSSVETEDILRMLNAFDGDKYIGVPLDNASDLSQLGSFDFEGAFDDPDEEKLADITATKEGDGKDVTYVFTMNEDAAAEALADADIGDAFEGYKPVMEATVTREGDAYSISVKGGAKEVSLVFGMTITYGDVDVKVPDEDDVITEESVMPGFSLGGDEPPAVVPVEPDEPVSGGPVTLTTPDRWLDATEPTVIDWDSFEQMDDTLSFGNVTGRFQHAPTGAAQYFQAVENFKGSDTASREAVLERYAEQVFADLTTRGFAFEYDVEVDEENDYVCCTGLTDQGNHQVEYEIWVSDETVGDTFQEVSIRYGCSTEGFNEDDISRTILECLGITVSPEDIQMAASLAAGKQAEGVDDYTVFIGDDDMNDLLTVSAYGDDIVVEMSTTIQSSSGGSLSDDFLAEEGEVMDFPYKG